MICHICNVCNIANIVSRHFGCFFTTPATFCGVFNNGVLTYMSIRDEITRLVADRKLHCLESALTGEETVRTLFVSQEIIDGLEQPYPSAKAHRLTEFREFLDAFLEGGLISVAEDPDLKPEYAMLARVHPVDEEFWDFRITAPKPGIRALGAFSEFDTFVLLTWEYREAIPSFNAEVERCKAEWREMFTERPYRGANLNAYLSNHYAV
jgi:hypothetical protein